MRLAPEARQRASDLEQLPLVVTGPDGQPRTLPLGQIATITQGLGPAQITHLDGRSRGDRPGEHVGPSARRK